MSRTSTTASASTSRQVASSAERCSASVQRGPSRTRERPARSEARSGASGPCSQPASGAVLILKAQAGHLSRTPSITPAGRCADRRRAQARRTHQELSMTPHPRPTPRPPSAAERGGHGAPRRRRARLRARRRPGARARRRDAVDGARHVHRDHGALGLRASRRCCSSPPGSTGRRRARSTSTISELGRLGERALARLRRERIGFVFQSFNLLGALTAEQNVGAARQARGHAPAAVGRPRRPRAGSGSTSAAATGRRSSRAASSSGSRSPARSSASRA